MVDSLAVDRGFGPDPLPDDPWSWTRVVFRYLPETQTYCIGSDGSIWSFRASSGSRHRRGRWNRLSPRRLPKTGHLAITLKEGGKPKMEVYIHRLVLEAFVGPCPTGLESCHRDGDPANNCLENLRWDTHLANMDDRRKHGRNINIGGKGRGGKRKIFEGDIPVIRDLKKQGVPVREIAFRYSVADWTIRKILMGRAWKHVQNIAS